MDEFSKGEKKLKRHWLWGGPDYEGASFYFIKAGNNLKKEKKYKEAAESFIKSAECWLSLGLKHAAGFDYIHAANCYKNIDNRKTCEIMRTAIDKFMEDGNFSAVAKYENELAEIYEYMLLDFPQAITCYEKAAEFHYGKDYKLLSDICLIRAACLYAVIAEYEKAIKIFEDVGVSSRDVPVLKFSANDYFLKAAMCRIILGKQQCDYGDDFSSSKEGVFLDNLIGGKDVSESMKWVKLDPWKVMMIKKMKKMIV